MTARWPAVVCANGPNLDYGRQLVERMERRDARTAVSRLQLRGSDRPGLARAELEIVRRGGVRGALTVPEVLVPVLTMRPAARADLGHRGRRDAIAARRGAPG
jgi:hypothetical protein